MATIRQQKALKAVVENGGIVSKAMIEAGYSEATAKTPQKLTESDGWQELMKKHLPDVKLAKVHGEGLKATHKRPHLIDRDDKGRPIYDYVEEDDFAVRHKYLDTAYKLKGSYAPEKQVQMQVKGDIKDFAKFKELKDKYEAELLTAMQHE